MTPLQIRVVLCTAEMGSISAAAKKLNIAQSNASNSIKALEKELGFAIFLRAQSGAALTEKGSLFVEHARRLMFEQEQIMGIRHQGETYTLRLGAVNYYTAIEPFLKLCAAHRDDAQSNFRYFSTSVEEGIEELAKRNLDVLVAPVLNSQITGLRTSCKENNLSMLNICTIPAVILVRKGHPAALDGRCEGIVQGSDALKEFPYVAFRNLFEDNSSTGYRDTDFVQCSYKMYVDEVDVRLRMVSSTNAFAFGCQSSASLLKRYGLVSFPVPGITLDMYCVTRTGEGDRREIADYLELLREELRSSLRIGQVTC